MLSFPNAKINLGLCVLSKRADGYHNLETVMYPVNIKDALEITDADATSLEILGDSIPGVTSDNLCLKAFNLLAEAYKLPPQKITLLKKIPIGAGLGGGSSDASAVLNLVDAKFNLQLSVDQKIEYATKLGADCAFFIENKPVLATGIGNVLEAISLDLSAYHIVVVMPDVHISTENAYKDIIPALPEISIKALIQKPVEEWISNLKNDFETSVFQRHPVVEELKQHLYNKGAIYASMSGSGASVFGIFPKEVDLQLPDSYRIYSGV